MVCVRAEDINISGSLYRNKLKYANFRRKHMQLGCISDVNCIYSSNCQIRRQEAKGFQLSSPCQPEEHQSSSRTLPLSISCQDPVAHHPRHGPLDLKWLRLCFNSSPEDSKNPLNPRNLEVEIQRILEGLPQSKWCPLLISHQQFWYPYQ